VRFQLTGTVAAVVGVLVAACSPSPRYAGTTSAREGVASYYAHEFNGRKTASGEIYDMHDMTAAHRKLPFDTRVRVINLSNMKSVVVRINDRGPFVKGRIIDVSYEAAKRLDMIEKGTARVRLEILD
jgi:rare lipoprotein A